MYVWMEKNKTCTESPDNFDMLNGNVRNIVMERNHYIRKQQVFSIKKEI